MKEQDIIYPDARGENTAEFYDYIVKIDGTVIGKRGHILKPQNNDSFIFYIDKERVTISKRKLLNKILGKYTYPFKEIVFPDGTNLDEVDFYGYKIRRDGIIYTPEGKISLSKSVIRVLIDGKYRNVSIPKLIYTIFSGEKLKRNEFIGFYDGDACNFRFDNLFVA